MILQISEKNPFSNDETTEVFHKSWPNQLSQEFLFRFYLLFSSELLSVMAMGIGPVS